MIFNKKRHSQLLYEKKKIQKILKILKKSKSSKQF